MVTVKSSEVVLVEDTRTWITKYWMSDLMERNHPWEADSHSPNQDILRLLWNPKLHYRVHKSPPLVRIQSQMHPIHTLPSLLSSHLLLGLPNGSSLQVIWPKFYIIFSSPPWMLHVPFITFWSLGTVIINLYSFPGLTICIETLEGKWAP